MRQQTIAYTLKSASANPCDDANWEESYELISNHLKRIFGKAKNGL
jgi:hypothetical protein